MKNFLIAMCALFAVAAQADVCTTGETRVFFLYGYSTQVGPNYRCSELARERSCVNGKWSESTPQCSQYDSGSCADFWIDQLNDSAFKFDSCE